MCVFVSMYVSVCLCMGVCAEIGVRDRDTFSVYLLGFHSRFLASVYLWKG